METTRRRLARHSTQESSLGAVEGDLGFLGFLTGPRGLNPDYESKIPPRLKEDSGSGVERPRVVFSIQRLIESEVLCVD
jgi:hypothetical protein